MSLESDENSAHIDSVDVDISIKENVSVSELTCDSGVETLESCSTVYPGSSDSDISPVKRPGYNLASDEKRSTSSAGNESESLTSSPTSISPDSNDLSDVTSCDKDFSLTKDECSEDLSSQSPAKDTSTESSTEIDKNVTFVPDLLNDNHLDVKPEPNYQFSATDISNVSNRAFTSSTVSLDEHNTSSTKSNVGICKSPYSRSAENISTVETNQNVETSSTKDLNADKILSDFSSHKNKVTATQKIPENPQNNIDHRYGRLPKELIPQDLGSIVKNVHGIFSSVSGSLKYAYNNTHRISMQKAPAKPVSKPIPNGKVMNDIFEDEIIDNSIKVQPNTNGVAKKGDNTESLPTVGSELNSEQESVESDCDSKKDYLKLQVETLEKMLAEQRKENSILRDKVKQQIDEMQAKDQTFKEFESKLDVMSKRVEQAEREKDAAVMRYASVECSGIEARRAADKAAAAEKAAVAELELMGGKLKSAHSEKQRICQLYDDKCHELSNCERELAKVRDDIKELEGRLKWTQSKLRMEMDAYKDSAERVEKLTQQVSELEAAKDAADGAKAKLLEPELKESQAALILCRHERDELERKLSTLTQQYDACAKERDSVSAVLARSTAEVEELKVRNLQLAEEAAELAALRAQAALADTLSAQLQRESERCSRAEQSLAEARALAETCARREASALEHAARLTAQHVAHRAAASDHHDKVQALSADNTSLRERITTLEEECSKLQTALSEETDRRNKENKVLARKVAELTEEVSEASKKLEWEKGENGVLKKKHASAIKELNRELQRALKRCEQLEAKLPPATSPSTRTGSVSSLSSGESAHQEDRLQNGHTDVPDIQVREPDRQALIERIVSLQRAAARRAERCEFLEEHAKQLTGELRNKAKLLRHLLCSLPAGAVASQDRDANKKEIARLGGGAMAALWGGDAGGITLPLSLEINSRLQAVLEDALLKNITLKENMDTLGAEISRLKEKMNTNNEAK